MQYSPGVLVLTFQKCQSQAFQLCNAWHKDFAFGHIIMLFFVTTIRLVRLCHLGDLFPIQFFVNELVQTILQKLCHSASSNISNFGCGCCTDCCIVQLFHFNITLLFGCNSVTQGFFVCDRQLVPTFSFITSLALSRQLVLPVLGVWVSPAVFVRLSPGSTKFGGPIFFFCWSAAFFCVFDYLVITRFFFSTQ